MRRHNPRYLEPTLLPAQSGDVLELDELWSFVQSKKQAVWLWVALCRRTRQVVAWHCRGLALGRPQCPHLPRSVEQDPPRLQGRLLL